MSDHFYTATHPKARQEHPCMLCGRTIGRGETYRRQGYIFDGRKNQTKVCAQCEAFAKALYKVGFEGDEGGWFYLPELDAGEVAHYGYGQELSRYRSRWRNDDGELVMPATLLEFAHASGGGESGVR